MLSELAPAPTLRHAYIMTLLEAVGIEFHIVGRAGRGRKARTRCALARSFLVKHHLGVPTTKAFREVLLTDEAMRALCGFWKEVPSESTFSRAFAEFARKGLADLTLDHLAKKALGKSVVMHVSRDSTAVTAREKPLIKPKKESAPKGRRGRKKGVPPAPKSPTRLERQLGQAVSVVLAELPIACDKGTKRNSKGHDIHWNGYKFHVDVTDQGIPISAVTTSASVHDSQVAIPLMRLTATRAMAVCYQLMDAGYAGKPIALAAEALGQIPIVAPRAYCNTPAIPLNPAQKSRFRGRTAVERFFSDLKDNRGGDSVRVRGKEKVHLHLMFGLLAILAMKLVAS